MVNNSTNINKTINHLHSLNTQNDIWRWKSRSSFGRSTNMYWGLNGYIFLGLNLDTVGSIPLRFSLKTSYYIMKYASQMPWILEFICTLMFSGFLWYKRKWHWSFSSMINYHMSLLRRTANTMTKIKRYINTNNGQQNTKQNNTNSRWTRITTRTPGGLVYSGR
jgi:hypothetical protein